MKPRGTKDIFYPNSNLWSWVEDIYKEVLDNACFTKIQTPIFEHTELFDRSIGEETDVVNKEMYTFKDKGGRSLTLRPEGTAGVVRAYVENKLYNSGLNKFWYSGPMFRYERPGKGRQREFHQLGIEVLSNTEYLVDVEVIATAFQIFRKLGLNDLKVNINSLGTKEDREKYITSFVEYLSPYKKELDKDSQRRLSTNPLRIFDSKDKKTQEICREAPTLLQSLNKSSLERFEAIKKELDALSICYIEDPYLVRGLDYYTMSVFEIITSIEDKDLTICGGGRYNNLVNQLGGPPTPAIGWAIGLERLISILGDKCLQPTLDFYIVSIGEEAKKEALRLSIILREKYKVEVNLNSNNLSKQFKKGKNAEKYIILGEEELKKKTVKIKNKNEQIEMPVDYFLKSLKIE